MSNTSVALARFRMPFLGIWALDGTHMATARTAVVSAYQPSNDARNAAKGGATAWRPPV